MLAQLGWAAEQDGHKGDREMWLDSGNILRFRNNPCLEIYPEEKERH